MSFSAVIRCDRDWTPGDRCRQASPVGIVDDLDHGRAQAASREGWSHHPDLGDACPACTRREQVTAVRRLPPAARLLAAHQLLAVGALDPADLELGRPA